MAINFQSNAAAAQSVIDSIEQKHPDVVTLALRADVGRMDECAELVGKVAKNLGGLDVVVANAVSLNFGKKKRRREPATAGGKQETCRLQACLVPTKSAWRDEESTSS